MDKVLVTGAPGWLGTRFVEFLRQEKREVRCIVMPNINCDYLKKLGVEIIEADLIDPSSLKGAMKDIDTVFHLAGLVHAKLRTNDFFKVNFEGTKNILDYAIKNKVKRFVYVSSNSPAGCNSERNILMNEFTSSKPYMKYGKSKYFAEQIINKAFILRQIETVILRPCWFYGIRQPDRQTKLMLMVKEGKALIFGDGKNLRSMTYIDNLCHALLLAEKSEAAKGETYWIADEKPYTMLEVYQSIAKALEVQLKIRKIPGKVSDVGRLFDSFLQFFGLYQKEIHVVGEMNKDIACSIEKAKKDLNYVPIVSLDEGMRRSVEWARKEGLL